MCALTQASGPVDFSSHVLIYNRRLKPDIVYLFLLLVKRHIKSVFPFCISRISHRPLQPVGSCLFGRGGMATFEPT